MREVIGHGTQSIISVLYSISRALVFVNRDVYTHTHKLADGRIIVHSHRHEKSNDLEPFASHHHSALEFEFLNFLQTLYWASLRSFSVISIPEESNVFRYIDQGYEINIDGSIQGRAPPTLL